MFELPVTGIGSWPGTDFAAALRLTLGELPQLPYLPELPARGPHAQLIGRTTAMLGELGVDRQPSGWRLLPGSGTGSADQRRAKSLLRDDLDQTEEEAAGWDGPFVISVAGPWTMAACVELPRGGPLLRDLGAVAELSAALAIGAGDYLAQVRRRLPRADVVVKVDEPILAAVATGSVPTASGWGKLPMVHTPELHRGLSEIYSAVADASPVLHSCARDVDWGTIVGIGYTAAADLGTLHSQDWDVLGAALDDGQRLWLGVAPTEVADTVTGPDELARRALRALLPLDLGGLAEQLVLTPACGFASWQQSAAVHQLRELTRAGRILAGELAC